MRDDTIYLTDLGDFTNRPISDFIYYWASRYSSRQRYLLDDGFDDTFFNEFRMAKADLISANGVFETVVYDFEEKRKDVFIEIIKELTEVREMVAELETKMSNVT